MKISELNLDDLNTTAKTIYQHKLLGEDTALAESLLLSELLRHNKITSVMLVDLSVEITEAWNALWEKCKDSKSPENIENFCELFAAYMNVKKRAYKGNKIKRESGLDQKARQQMVLRKLNELAEANRIALPEVKFNVLNARKLAEFMGNSGFADDLILMMVNPSDGIIYQTCISGLVSSSSEEDEEGYEGGLIDIVDFDTYQAADVSAAGFYFSVLKAEKSLETKKAVMFVLKCCLTYGDFLENYIAGDVERDWMLEYIDPNFQKILNVLKKTGRHLNVVDAICLYKQVLADKEARRKGEASKPVARETLRKHVLTVKKLLCD